MNNEDIKVLEEYLDKQDRKFVSEYRLALLQAIENLIKEYKELEEENKELHKEINQRVKLKLENERIVDEDYIPKSKVREKIEELDNRIKELEGIEGNEEAIEILKLRLQDILELLEERN